MPDDAGEYAYGENLAPGQRFVAPYAASQLPSRGRYHDEPACPTRSPVQRDRDRILHSSTFRRLIHKTQVFIYHEGDHYRTRLTHSLEVAQIARTIARQLLLDEDLAEALALAHDVGHPPFGHAGERALDHVMADVGGFDHNAQSLRVVIALERKYLPFDGLNLSWECLEGLAKHNGPVTDPDSPILKVLRIIEAWQSIEPAKWAAAEAQVAALADDIAYLSHDIDDGLRAGLLTLEDLDGAPLVAPLVEAARRQGKDVEERSRLTYEVTRRMITLMIRDVVLNARQVLSKLAPASPDDIRNAPAATVLFSPALSSEILGLRAFLMERVYRSDRILPIMRDAEGVVSDLFTRYLSDNDALPDPWQSTARDLEHRKRARLIGDFVAGMTDRYALIEHRRLFDATPDLR